MNKIRVLSLFSGIGAFEKALNNIGVPYKLINYCEIDKYASKSYSAIHGVDESLNLWDVTKINPMMLEDFDMVTHGSPCQDYSVAGKGKGGDADTGTRSSLMWYTVNIIKVKYPKYVIWENVKGVLSPKHKHNFDKYINELNATGYNSYYSVLNAKHYGVPQNRERIYVISIRKDIDKKDFKFPEPFDNGLRLKDLLEEEVDEKYYISQDKTDKLIQQLKDKVIVKEATKKGYAEAYEGDSINLEQPNSKTRRGRVGTQQANTLTTQCNQAVVMLTERRTEEAKAIRRENMKNGIDYCPRRGKELVPRQDEISNCITTTQTKEHLLLENQGILINHGELKIKDDEITSCLDSSYYKGLGNHAQRTGILQVGMLDIKGNEQVRRVYNPEGCSPTLNTMAGGNRQPKILEPQYRIRKLTPRETWKLMSFSDEDFDRASKVCSNSQLYKQAGNSIVCKVLEAIFKNLFKEYITIQEDVKKN